MSKSLDLPNALHGQRVALDADVWPLSYYIARREDDEKPPLLLIHSVNAAASAYEVRPIFSYYRGRRTVVAMDLPGFGFSARRAQRYTPRLMTDAVHAMVARLIEITGHSQVHALACSLSCEYLARAAVERPERYRSLALVSPTGFDEDRTSTGPYAYSRGRPWLYRGLTASSPVARNLFKAIASRRSIRYFLKKTWGTDDIDENVFRYAYRTAHQPNARHAPLSFLSGYLFSADAGALYTALTPPVWLAYGTLSDFTDYRAKHIVDKHSASRMVSFEAGALPHFQQLDEFTRSYDAFSASIARAGNESE